jgi:trigger factor
MEREVSEGVKTLVKTQIMDGLLEANNIPLPQAMVREEIEHLAERMGLSSSKEHNEGIAEAKATLFGEEARRRVALGLLMNQVVAVNDIKLDNARLQSKLESIASTYQDSAEAIRSFQQDAKALENIRALALEEQVVDWLLERADVTDKPSSFDEVTRPNRVQKTSSEE